MTIRTFGYYLRKTGACAMMLCSLLGLLICYGGRNVEPFLSNTVLLWSFAGVYILFGLLGLGAFALPRTDKSC
jgi:hypothetical protein